MEQTKFTRFKRISILFITGTILTFGLSMMKSSNVSAMSNTKIAYNYEQVKDVNKNDKVISHKDSIKEIIISEVSEYLQKQSPRAHKFIPKYLVQAGLNNNIDICFMMAQTQIETNFGTTGAGRESSRHSLFGVVVRKYSNYENAINDYCRLLKKSYLGKGRTEKHLMTKYVTHSGARYAGNRNYEAELSRAYKNIVKRTRIYNLQQEWNRVS